MASSSRLVSLAMEGSGEVKLREELELEDLGPLRFPGGGGRGIE